MTNAEFRAHIDRINAEMAKRPVSVEVARLARIKSEIRKATFIGPRPPWWRLFAMAEWKQRVRDAEWMRVTRNDVYAAGFAIGTVESVSAAARLAEGLE